MRKKILGTDLKVSAIGFGCMGMIQIQKRQCKIKTLPFLMKNFVLYRHTVLAALHFIVAGLQVLLHQHLPMPVFQHRECVR